MASPKLKRVSFSKSKLPHDDLGILVYASNLLGSDPTVTNFGGGNTSIKSQYEDPISGAQIEVMHVKASGGDLGSATSKSFATLNLNQLLSLEKRWASGVHEDDLVPLYGFCSCPGSTAAPSIDTPLHGFLPHKAVSHVHPDSVIAIAASHNSEELTKKIYRGNVGFLPWKRPGFELGIQLRDLALAHPEYVGAVLGGHGLICWANDWESCYELTLDLIEQAQSAIDSAKENEPLGPVSKVQSELSWQDVLPILRGKVTFNGQRMIGHIFESEEIHEFLGSAKGKELAHLGTSCPDHFLRTKIRPLWLSIGTEDDLKTIDFAFEQFRTEYEEYYNRCKKKNSPAMRNPNPNVILIPGLGMATFGKNATEARVSGEFFVNAMHVMKGAETLDKYTALPEQEAFDIEYWLLEEAKLRRQPPEKELSRQVALVTGGAQGIGKATCLQLAELGACVAALDINQEKLDEAVKEIENASGSKDAVVGIKCDVTDRESLANAFTGAIKYFGGIDIVVVNAGNARRGTVIDTDEADYDLLSKLLMKGYFDTIGEAVKAMKHQGIGGSIVVVGSKNGVAVGSNAALYSAAKAYELHLMRAVALDFAKDGIRCNAVNPDGVVQGSGIWSDAWRSQTAKSLGIEPDQLEEYYRNRNLLKVHVTPNEVAKAIVWLASEARSSRTTAAVIPVDGGNREGILR